MTDAGELTPEQIVEKIVAEKTVTPELIQALQAHIRADWVVDHAEVEMLFACNQAIDHADQKCPEWIQFFTDKVARLIVMDMDTPGEIDAAEGIGWPVFSKNTRLGTKRKKSCFTSYRTCHPRFMAELVKGYSRSKSK